MSDSPIDLLKEEMESDEISLRVNAIHRTKVIASIIGFDGIKNQLLTYFDVLIKKEDDEVLFAIAEELGNLRFCKSIYSFFVSYFLPGSITILLPYLEQLSSNEETVVRDMAVKSLNLIRSQLTDYEILNQYLPLVFRLALPEANFTQHVSAIHLMYPVYQKAGNQKDKIKSKFNELCQEETPIVRRVLAQTIGSFAQAMEKDYVLNDLIGQFKQLSGDDQDSVRVLCLSSLQTLAQILTKDENKTHTLPVIIAATEDKSWRVRLALAKNFCGLAEAFGKEITEMSLIQMFTNLLKDNENDVKYAAVMSLKIFIKNIQSDKLVLLIPHLQNLAKDGPAQIKGCYFQYSLDLAGVADIFAGMFQQFAKDTNICKQLLPFILEFLNQADGNTIDIKISGLRAATKYIQFTGVEALSQMMIHYKTAITSEKWKMRYAVLEQIVDLATHFNSVEIFTKHMDSIFFTYLRDKVNAIRTLGAQKLKSLTAIFKADWANAVLPKIMDCLPKENSYCIRITALQSLQSLVTQQNLEVTAEKILPLLLKALKDPVSNVKITGCKLLKTWNKGTTDKYNKTIKSSLQECLSDLDNDVQFYAQEAIQSFA